LSNLFFRGAVWRPAERILTRFRTTADTDVGRPDPLL
jgi:hypothetical protein